MTATNAAMMIPAFIPADMRLPADSKFPGLPSPHGLSSKSGSFSLRLIACRLSFRGADAD